MRISRPGLRLVLNLVLALAAGGIGYLAFPGPGIWALALVSVAGLMAALVTAGTASSYLIAFSYGFALFLPMFHWAEISTGRLEWLLLVIASATIWGVFGLAWSQIRRLRSMERYPWLAAIALAALWNAVEEVRAIFPFGGFPWGRMAFSQADAPIGRMAWLGGAGLVSFTVALVGALIWGMVCYATRGQTWRACGVLMVGAGLAVGPLMIGLDSRPQAGNLRVGAVQGNVPTDPSLTTSQERQQVLNNHLAGTTALVKALDGDLVDLVAWPEDSVDTDPVTHPDEAELITRSAQAAGVPILIGTQEFPQTGGRYNVSLLWDGQAGSAIGRYAKRHPVPFGEYIPLRALAAKVSSHTDEVSTDMLAGDEVGVLNLPTANRLVPIGTVICFEVAYDDVVRDAVNAGAEILIVQTNNASFGRSLESAQQLAMSRLRAIEHGRATVHISTTGISAMISPAGILLEQTGFWTAEQMVQTLPLRTSLTPAARLASTLSWVFLLSGVGLTLGAIARRAATAKRKDQP